jgi:hypothetical protein
MTKPQDALSAAEDAYERASIKLALVIRLADAAQYDKCECVDPENAQKSWRGLEWLLRSINEDVDIVNAAAEMADGRSEAVPR